LETASDCGYLAPAESKDMLARCERIGKMLGGMIEKADLFCGELKPTLREPAAEYFVESDSSEEQ
jgi:hypothetical protein